MNIEIDIHHGHRHAAVQEILYIFCFAKIYETKFCTIFLFEKRTIRNEISHAFNFAKHANLAKVGFSSFGFYPK
jgi:hypothetical protein